MTYACGINSDFKLWNFYAIPKDHLVFSGHCELCKTDVCCQIFGIIEESKTSHHRMVLKYAENRKSIGMNRQESGEHNYCQ